MLLYLCPIVHLLGYHFLFYGFVVFGTYFWILSRNPVKLCSCITFLYIKSITFLPYLPLERAWTFILKKPTTYISFTQGCFVPSLVEIGSSRVYRRCLKSSIYILVLFYLLSTFGKGSGHPLKSITQRCFLPDFVEIGLVVL